MRAIQHHLVLLAGLALLAFLVGPVPALWVAVAIVVSVGVHRLTRVLLFVDTNRRGGMPFAVPLALTVMILSAVLIVAGAVLLFLRFGWKPPLGFVVLLVAYVANMEDEFHRSRRKASTVRTAMRELIDARISGTITQDQLAARAALILQRDLPRHAYHMDYVFAALISADGLSPAQHRRLLELLQRHLTEAEIHGALCKTPHRDLAPPR